MIKSKSLDFCLLIPCYDNLDGLLFSLRSVTYYPDRFMVLIVDDGSVVPVTSASIRLGVKINFPLFILRNEVNQGIAAALNSGLQWIEENEMVALQRWATRRRGRARSAAGLSPMAQVHRRLAAGMLRRRRQACAEAPWRMPRRRFRRPTVVQPCGADRLRSCRGIRACDDA